MIYVLPRVHNREGLLALPRVHNVSREGECLTAYTCFKRTASSTESTPSGVN